jgi:hypothetical protein
MRTNAGMGRRIRKRVETEEMMGMIGKAATSGGSIMIERT